MSSRGLAVLVVMSLFAAPAVAQVDPLEAAEAAYQSGELDRALQLYSAARDAGGRDAGALARIQYRLGVLRASIGDEVGARAAFEVALALEPALESPAELSPEQRGSFEELQRERRGPLGLELTAPRELEPGSEVQMTLSLTDAPPSLVTRVRLTATPEGDAAPWTVVAALTERSLALSVPGVAWQASRRLVLRAEALDAYGSVVATASAEVRAPIIEVLRGAAPSETQHDDGGVLASPWFWVVTLGILAAGGAAAGVVVGTTEHRYTAGPVRFE